MPQSESPLNPDEIEKISMQVRSEWKLGNLPIENLQFLLESHGIIVTFFTDVEKEIDAFSQRVELSSGPVYIISLAVGDKPIERLRFDMGHELGHILLHPWDEQEEELGRDTFLLRERQANIFSSSFLLPRDSFFMDIKACPTSVEYYLYLKKKWQVSAQAMIYRARQLEIISENQFFYMMKVFSKNGWRHKEPGDIPGRLNSTVFQSALDLLFDGGYLDSHQLRMEFNKNGILLCDRDLEDLMGLKDGTIKPETTEMIPFENGKKEPPLAVKKQDQG